MMSTATVLFARHETEVFKMETDKNEPNPEESDRGSSEDSQQDFEFDKEQPEEWETSDEPPIQFSRLGFTGVGNS